MIAAYVKLFTKDVNSEKSWKNTGLQGYLTLVFDRAIMGYKLMLFHPTELNLLFEIEVFLNFMNAYIV
jgi:hypothetical protein